MNEPRTKPALPGEECQVPPHKSWSVVEKWAWQEVGSGRIANLNVRLGYVAPRKLKDWRPERSLRAAFLETILMYEPWRSAIPRQGVRIEGALLDEELDLEGAQFPAQLWLDRSRFTGDLKLAACRTSSLLSLAGSEMVGNLSIPWAALGALNLRKCRVGGKLDLRGTKLEGAAELSGAMIVGKADLSAALVGGDLFAREEPVFSSLVAIRAEIKGQVSVHDARVRESFVLSGSTIGADLFIRGKNIIDEMRAVGAIVGRSVDLDTITSKRVTLDSMIISGNLSIGKKSEMQTLTLNGVDIKGQIIIGGAWTNPGSLELRNAKSATVQDRVDAWPDKLDLDGFSYSRFSGLGKETPNERRTSAWFKTWLQKQEPYTPQPYQQCAKVLREMGHREMADDVLYEGRERERKELWQRANSFRKWARSLGLWLLKATIGYGYGYRYFRSLWWVLLLVIVGVIVLAVSGEYTKIPGVIEWSAASSKSIIYNIMDLTSYNFDIILPIVSLHDSFDKIEITVPIRYYFYFERIMGYVLGSFLIAGLAGLTK